MLKVSKEKTLINVDKYGNTDASIAIALDEALSKRKLKKMIKWSFLVLELDLFLVHHFLNGIK